MKENKVLYLNGYVDQDIHDNVNTSIKQLQFLMESEIVNKQKTIDLLQAEIIRLRKDLHAEVEKVSEYEMKMQEAVQSVEGNRQLVNKLLNDMERMQQDIGWYKRTYESRSLLGVIMNKLKVFK